jgi:hypothetical protein
VRGLKRLLPFFSYAFHPLFISLYALLYWLLLDFNFLNQREKYLLLIQVSIITIFIPVCFFFMLRSLGRIDSMMARELKERKIPLMIQAILIYLLIRQSVTVNNLPELYFFFFAVLISTLAALVFLFFEVKVSLHMMGMAGLIFFVVGLGFHNKINLVNTAAFLFVITGFVASSRLYMAAHNLRELAYGFFAGMIPQMALWFLWV